MKLLEKAERFGHDCSTGQRGLSGLGGEEQHDSNNRSIKKKMTMVTDVCACSASGLIFIFSDGCFRKSSWKVFHILMKAKGTKEKTGF